MWLQRKEKIRHHSFPRFAAPICLNVAIAQVTNYNLASNSYVNTSLHEINTSISLKPFGIVIMSKTVYIESAAQFSSLISSSSIVVADCKYAPPCHHSRSASYQRRQADRMTFQSTQTGVDHVKLSPRSTSSCRRSFQDRTK
jgi:hypothetical protein